jgi:hypothetical protein
VKRGKWNWKVENGDGSRRNERNGHETRIEKFLVVLMLMIVDLGSGCLACGS